MELMQAALRIPVGFSGQPHARGCCCCGLQDQVKDLIPIEHRDQEHCPDRDGVPERDLLSSRFGLIISH